MSRGVWYASEMKKPKKSTLINKLDKLVSLKVRSLGHCERCGKKAELVQLQPAHIYSRAIKVIRFDSENILCLCAACHFWGHMHPADFVDWIRDRWPGRIESLREKMKNPKTLTIKWYQEQLEQ